jgi:CheY-like chemotaxis protein
VSERSAPAVGRTDFLDVLRRRAATGAPGATDIVVGVQAILEGRRSGLRLEYRWDDRRETNWFLLSATGEDGGHAGAIVTRGKDARRSLQVRIVRTDTVPTERPRLPDPKPAARPLVLVAEDDPQAGELLWHYLQEAGCAVARAYTGEQALRMAAELQPAVITVDTLLPDWDGLEVLALLKALPATREIAVIVVSVTQPREVAFELGALEWLVKPVSSTVLLDALRRGCPERVTALGVREEGLV